MSSFGAYGANAHLILEESPVPESGYAPPNTGEANYLIPLSAKTRERLHAYAGRLKRFLTRTGSGAEPLRLQDIAYTLQTGRQALEERVIFLVKNLQELGEKLKAFESGQTVSGLHSGSLKDGKKFNQLLGPDDVRELAGKWMAQGQAAKVAQLWVQGGDLDWGWFHGQERLCRISLPPYPFARERYWIPSDQPDTPIQAVTPADTSLDKKAQTLLLAPVWKTIPLPEPAPLTQTSTEQVVVMSRNGEGVEALKKIYPHAAFLPMDGGTDDEFKDLDMDHLIWVVPPAPLASPGDETIIKGQDGPGGLFAFFRMIKTLLALGYGNRELRLTLITTQTLALGQNHEANPTHAGLHGFLGSIAREYPLWQARLMDLDATMDWPVRQFTSLPFDAGAPFVYRNKEWHQSRLVPFRSSATRQPPYRHQGVYVVIGGAGGLGEAWSKLMIQQYQARIVWIGRRSMDSTIQGKLDALARLGHAPIYVPADAGNQESLQRAYHTIKQTYPRIHGVVHSAVGVFDQSMATMEEKRFREILSVKVDVSVRLARVFQEEPL
ncbi:SDR family NAD(P)-dependent oxidoreductase, partial [Desulfobacter sp.]|uniref:SDR family NAD(P)-dependent oxidoreductase n=1 Tax=Desulfobacter sp. TaxID=2294 RepID=UPI003D1477BE